VLSGRWEAADVPGWSWTEHTVLDPALSWTPEQITASACAVLARLP